MLKNNSNIGLIWTMQNNSRLTLDYWSIDYKNRIELENGSVKASSDPDSIDIIRNDQGFIVGVHTSFFNEEKSEISGIDVSFDTYYDFAEMGSLSYKIQGTSFLDYLTPDKDTGFLINRVGLYNFDAHMHSIPKYKINSFIKWERMKTKVNITSRYISGYDNKTPVSSSHADLGYTNKVGSSMMFDIGVEQYFNTNKYDMVIGINAINVFDKNAPRLYNPPDFSFDPNVHDARGRLINLSIQLNF